jgi:hypothetical protein
VLGPQQRRWPVMLDGGFNVLVAVDLEEALHELGPPDDAEKRRQEAHAAGKTNLSGIDKELQPGSLPCGGCDSRLSGRSGSGGLGASAQLSDSSRIDEFGESGSGRRSLSQFDRCLA